jgi:uncharacterized membrane protein YkvA (DUF1232 family)
MAGTRDPHVDLDPDMIGPEDTRESRVRAGFWRTLKRAARQIPFLPDVVAAYYCALDPQTPAKVRFTLLAALAYFVSPVDLVPDLLPVIGFTDDAAVLMAALSMVRAHIGPDHHEAARRALAEE